MIKVKGLHIYRVGLIEIIAIQELENYREFGISI